MNPDEHGLSEVVSLILIVFLIIVVALFITMALTGTLDRMLQKPALVAVTATPFETGTGTAVIRLEHKQGDPVLVKGTTHSEGVSIVEIVLVDSAGTAHPLSGGAGITRPSWSAGTSLYIIPSATPAGYELTESPSGNIGAGAYKIRIIDTRTQVLLHSLNTTIST